MKIALLQINSAWEDESRNCKTASHLLAEAAHAQCDVAVLPEMFSTGFTMNLAAVSDGLETTGFLAKQAKKWGINIIAGIAGKKPHDRRGTNSALVFDRIGCLRGRYTKINAFPLTSETDSYRPGKKPVIFRIDEVLASVFICYDLRFPELFRQVSADVQVVFVIANWPAERMNHWEALLKARAIENQCFVVGVNRLGKDGNGMHYTGGSLVFDPLGNTVVQLSWRDAWGKAEIDPAMVAAVRQRYPFLPK
ncbi:MAG TPA: nitrilase-related carbon-nitrogen hydrolase [Dissulfurispiraceae bacterium]|nr:nitrilase-related carbon-nitrogen hydrolase [Dissulfurispiraceae bacterium]